MAQLVATVEGHVPTKKERVLAETLERFDLRPQAFPFDEKRIRKIEERRQQLEGKLFFDYLLEQAGIVQPTKIFPPKSIKVFKHLVEEILNSQWPSNHDAFHDASRMRREFGIGLMRTCLIYYLLAWWGTDRLESYSDHHRLPTQFAELTHGYFLLDTGNARTATSLLCSPLIEQSIPSKIFQALSIATDADPSVLVLRYARMAKAPLDSIDSVIIYVTALAKVNFVEAWNYQRGENGDARSQLMSTILNAILTPRPIRTALHLLTALPLRGYERDFLHSWAVNPTPGVSEDALAHLHSALTLRLTQEGDYTAAVQLNREFHQYAHRLLNSDKKRSAGVGYDADALSQPATIISQKAQEWREILQEAIALLPIEHRRALESKMNETDISIGTLSGLSTTITIPAPIDNGMEMSWENIDPVGHSTPPRLIPSTTVSASNQGTTSALATPAASPLKRSSRVAKSSPLAMPIETQTVGRVTANNTPRRPGAISYMTPLRTPSLIHKSNISDHFIDVDDLGRSGAPPPSTHRASSKNAFFDPNVRTIRGPVFSETTPKNQLLQLGPRSRKVSGDVEMLDATADETEAAGDEANRSNIIEESDDSFVIAPQPKVAGRLSAGAGGLLSASSVVQIKKAQERQQERGEREKEAREREKERQAARERELALKKAKFIEQRRSLGGSESSFGPGPSVGKRKRDGDDNMSREDEERDNASESGGARGKRKSDSGTPQVVHRSPLSQRELGIVAPFSVSVPEPAKSAASVASKRGVVASASATPSIAPAEEAGSEAALRRSSRVSNPTNSASGSVAGGSQVGGSVRGPSPTPETAEESDEDEGHDSPRVPGAFIYDDEMETSPRKTRGRAKPSETSKPASKAKSTRVKPDSKAKKSSTPNMAPSSPAPSVASVSSAQTRQTRGKRMLSGNVVSVPQPIAEDAILEAVDEEGESPRKAGTRGKKATATASVPVPATPSSSTRRSTRNAAPSAVEATEVDTDEAGARRTSRRLNAPSATQGEGSAAGSSAAGGRKTGRKA
ncbi:hypothetical protein FRC20_004920 [Serendipita sp. 405]|nr:hypothetical protein FRC15_002908 [Serendipita sp. 397]KAG8799015.1 hypothetical protein FRC16_005974 [Serendipita sp. 398]KAG8867767.1 hypothetical protein FRC20_004920 [Serendipita sp. 405]